MKTQHSIGSLAHLLLCWLALTTLFFMLVANGNNKKDLNIRQKSSSQLGERFFYPSLKSESFNRLKRNKRKAVSEKSLAKLNPSLIKVTASRSKVPE